MKNTFWLFTAYKFFEIVATEEDRNIWKFFLKDKMFNKSFQYLQCVAQRDAIAMVYGNHLACNGQYIDATTA
jgi:vacuolar protein sorting-associated protein 18